MNKVTILDGGMGRELDRMGAPFSRPLWSAEALMKAPEMVVKAHCTFIEAGAEIITTNSYACVPFHLGEQLYNERGVELAELAAKLAFDAVSSAKRKVLVAGSLPPPMGSYRPDLFDEQIAQPVTRALYQAMAEYVDLWIVETISSLAEFDSTAAVLRDTKKPVYFAFTLDDNSAAPQLRSGESLSDAVDRVVRFNAAGLMFNCSIPEVMGDALVEAKRRIESVNSDLQLGVYANKFTPIKATPDARSEAIETREVGPEGYLEFAKEWQRQGAVIIGGCCGIGPEHIEVLSRWQHSPETSA